jgi:hypothetical protein
MNFCLCLYLHQHCTMEPLCSTFKSENRTYRVGGRYLRPQTSVANPPSMIARYLKASSYPANEVKLPLLSQIKLQCQFLICWVFSIQKIRYSRLLPSTSSSSTRGSQNNMPRLECLLPFCLTRILIRSKSCSLLLRPQTPRQRYHLRKVCVR